MSQCILNIDNLRVDYEQLVAVDGLSMQLFTGDVMGLIGPNGAGKTTSMRAVCGLSPIHRGTITVLDADVAKSPVKARSYLGFMVDVAPLYDKLTVLEYLDHYARANQIGDRPERIDICLQLTWLTEKRKTLCAELSRGMKQRLTLAKTLLTDPPLLLLDEPASGIDPLGRIELRKLILDLQRMDKAILVSSHILTEMSGFCNKVTIMERGRLVRTGMVSDLVSDVSRRPMLVKWRAQGVDAVGLLKAMSHIQITDQRDHEAVIEIAGDETLTDDTLKELIVAGVRIVEWRAQGDALEHLLLQSGAREVG